MGKDFFLWVTGLYHTQRIKANDKIWCEMPTSLIVHNSVTVPLSLLVSFGYFSLHPLSSGKIHSSSVYSPGDFTAVTSLGLSYALSLSPLSLFYCISIVFSFFFRAF